MEPIVGQLWTGLALAWEHRGLVVIGTFLLGVVVEQVDRERARFVHVLGWLGFAIYLLSMVGYFFFEQQSAIIGVGTLLGAPLAAAVGYRLWNGHDSLFVLSRALAFGGLIYFPVTTLEFLRRPLIETVTSHTAVLLDVVGSNPDVVGGTHLDPEVYGKEYRINAKPEEYGHYVNTFVYDGETVPITYTIVIACTGIGSMAVFGGLIAAVDAPFRRKLTAAAVSIPVIYVLNLVRNVFIAIGFGEQRFQIFPNLIVDVLDLSSATMVSYIIADRIIAQSASVVALVVITWLVVRQLPEVLVLIDETVAALTGIDLGLVEALGVEPEGSEDSTADSAAD